MKTNPHGEEAIGQLPRPIVEKLELLIRRMRRILWLRGGLAVAAVTLATLLTLMAIDATVVLFSITVRWLLSLVGLAIVMAAIYRFLVRPLSRRYSLTRIARLIEIRHPELQERISSSVELLGSTGQNGVSQRMVEELVKEAVEEVKSVSPSKEFDKSAVVPYVTGTAIAAAVLLGLLAIWPTQTMRLMARALVPFARIGNIYSVGMTVEPGDALIAKGDSFVINVGLKDRRGSRVELRRSRPGERDSVERMSRVTESDGEGVVLFETQIPSVHTSFSYRVRSARALSAYYNVTAVPRPAVKNLRVMHVYPEYTGLAAMELTNSTGDIVAPLGTRLEMTADLNKAVTNAGLRINGLAIEMPAKDAIGSAGTMQLHWPLELKSNMSGGWSLDLVDQFGFGSAADAHMMEVIPDTVPSIEMVVPRERRLKLKPTDVVELGYIINEDYGVAGVELLMGKDSKTLSVHSQHSVLAMPEREKAWGGMVSLDLAKLDLNKTKILQLKLAAIDTLPQNLGGPQRGESEVLIITLDRSATSLAEQTVAAQAEEINKTLEGVQDRLEDAKAKSDKHASQMKEEELSEEARAALEEIRHQLDASERTLEAASKQLEDSAFDKLSDAMEEMRGENVEPALEMAQMLPLSDSASERGEQMQQMQMNMEQSLEQMRQMLQQLEMRAKDLKALARIQDLAAQEKALAEQLAQQRAEDKEKLEWQWRDQQKQASQQFRELLADRPASAAEQLRQQRDQARDLAKNARDLAQEQSRLHDALQNSKNGQNSEQLKSELVKEMARRQEEIAGAASELKQSGEQLQQPSQAPLGESHQQAQNAASHLNKDEMKSALAPAEQAGKNLKDAANQLQKEQRELGMNAADPAASWEQHKERGEMAKDAGKLAERQQRLVKAMKAVEAGELEKALAELQKDSGKKDSALAQETNQLRNETQSLFDSSAASGAAQAAERSMQTAAQQARKAAGAVPAAMQPAPAAQEGQPAPPDPAKPASDAQQKAEAELNNAAKNLDQMAGSLDKMAREQASHAGQPLLDVGMMSDLHEQMGAAQAAQSADAAHPSVPAASQNMQQLAEAMATSLDMQSQPGESSPNAGMMSMLSLSMPGMGKGGDGNRSNMLPGQMPKMFEALGVSKADWLRMKGELRSDIAGSDMGDVPEEYRELVKKYFQEVARRGAESANVE